MLVVLALVLVVVVAVVFCVLCGVVMLFSSTAIPPVTLKPPFFPTLHVNRLSTFFFLHRLHQLRRFDRFRQLLLSRLFSTFIVVGVVVVCLVVVVVLVVSSAVTTAAVVCLQVDKNLKPLPVNVRVGQAVETVGQAGKPKTITGFQTHTTPVLLGVRDRAEVCMPVYASVTCLLVDGAARRSAIVCCAVLCCAVMCCAVLCCAAVCCAVLRCDAVCCAVLWYGVV